MKAEAKDSEAKPVEVEKTETTEDKSKELAIFSEDGSTAKVLRKVKILDRSKEFRDKASEGKGDAAGKLEQKKLEEDNLKAIRSAFENWSIDKKSIGRAQVVSVLRKAGMMPSEEDLDSIMEGMDTDKSGKIQWEQWLKAYTRKNQRRKKSNDPDDVRNCDPCADQSLTPIT